MGGQLIEGVKRLTAFSVPAERFCVVGVDTKHRSVAEHPQFDARVLNLPIIEEWVRDFMVHGWSGGTVTVVVDDDGGVIPLDGKQRILHVREANRRLKKAGRELIEIPVMVKKGEDHDKYGAMIALNEFRRDDSLLEKARKAQALINFGRSLKEVASRFGKSEMAIKQWLSLLEADPKVITAVETNKISGSVAIELAKLPRAQQMTAYTELQKQDRLNVEAAKQGVFIAKSNGASEPATDEVEAEPAESTDADEKGGSVKEKKPRTRAAKTEDEPDGRGKKLPINAIRKICVAYDADELTGKAKDLTKEDVKLLKAVSGLANPRTVGGLTAALVQVGWADKNKEESE